MLKEGQSSEQDDHREEEGNLQGVGSLARSGKVVDGPLGRPPRPCEVIGLVPRQPNLEVHHLAERR